MDEIYLHNLYKLRNFIDIDKIKINTLIIKMLLNY